jgi:hypothetical protein
MALILKHQTVQEFVSRFREAYRNAERQRLIQLATFILNRIAAGDITDANCRNAFGLNTTQWNALKTKMQNYITANSTVQSAQGE